MHIHFGVESTLQRSVGCRFSPSSMPSIPNTTLEGPAGTKRAGERLLEKAGIFMNWSEPFHPISVGPCGSVRGTASAEFTGSGRERMVPAVP